MDKSHVLEEIEIGRAEFDALLGQKLDAWLMGMLPSNHENAQSTIYPNVRFCRVSKHAGLRGRKWLHIVYPCYSHDHNHK